MAELMVSAEELSAAIHEASNALTVVLGWLERADQAAGTDERQTALDRARLYAERARGDLRSAIGAEARGQRAGTLRSLLSRLREDLEAMATDAGSRVTITIQRDGQLPHADRTWQVLINLALNALRASGPGGEVHIVACGAEDAARIWVCDSGPGVANDFIDSLFVRGASRSSGGAGIGLAHARALARQFGGDLCYHAPEHRPALNLPLPSGACFELTWPVSKAPVALAPLAGRSVILLEDDPAIAELLDLSLTSRGVSVALVTTEAALFDRLQAAAADVLLVDLSPLKSPLATALKRLRDSYPEMQVMLITGQNNIAIPAGVAHLRKPFTPAELRQAIGEMLACAPGTTQFP